MTTPRRRRWPWILGAVAVAIPLAAFLALRAFVNPDAIRPRLIAAVEEATGRRFTVGEIGLALSLRPTLELRYVALANMDGGSRPDMLTASRVEVQAALLPLLSNRLEVARVVLDTPDLLLETDAGGRANWVFQPPAPPAAAPSTQAAPPQPAAPRAPMALDLGALRIESGRVTWRDGRTGVAETAEIPSLDAAAPLAGPTTARGTLRLRGQEVAVQATTGALAALGGEFPFDLSVAAAGAEARAEGRLSGQDWQAAVEARAPDLSRLAPLLPDAPLPPLRDVVAAARLAGTGAAPATAEAIALRIGASDLSFLRPGLALTRAEVTATRADAPLALTAEATLAGAPLRLAGTAGTPAGLLSRAGPLPLDLRAEAAGAEATLRGAIRDPAAIAGVDLALAARIPDLAALSPLAGTPLPAIRDIAAAARIAERTPGFQGGAHLRGVTLTAAPVEARGDLTLIVGERPGLTGRLDIPRLDLDAIRAAMPAPRPAAPAPPAEAPAPQVADGRVIPDLPIPVGALRTADADLTLAIATLTAAGAPWRDIETRIRLDAGQGSAPVSVVTPGGPLTLDVAADARAATPTLRMAARAPGLDLAPLQRALGRPVALTGRAELDADLRGAGAALRAVGASLSGHLGLAMLDGTVEQPILAPAGAALRARVPVLPPIPDRLPFECFALRADLVDGTARIGTFLFDAPAAKVAGSGTVNLGTEAIAMRLLHDVRAAGQVIRVGADLAGTLANPAYRGVGVQNAADALAGALSGRVGGDLGQVLGALANRPGARPEPLPDCAPALAAARGGRQGPVPAARPAAEPPAQPAPAAPAPAAPAAPQINDLLRGLLRR